MSPEWLADEPGFSEEAVGFFMRMKNATIIMNLAPGRGTEALGRGAARG